MTKQPIMIRVVVVCPVTGCYSVRWVPLNEAIHPDRSGSPSASFVGVHYAPGRNMTSVVFMAKLAVSATPPRPLLWFGYTALYFRA